jgi:ribose transport system ATP-binding protein
MQNLGEMTSESRQVNGAPLLEMRSIIKTFPGVKALQEVDFNVTRGEVHALVGENGAGKSTLMKIVAGVYTRDGGEMLWKGAPVHFTSPKQAQLAGITTIHQELNLIPQMSVTENIFLGDEIEGVGGLLDWKTMHEKAREMLGRLHLDIDPRTCIDELGVGKQQMVEVAKALHYRADLIIMDEPTAALSLSEIEDLFEIIRQLRSSGVSIIYISHHLEETFEISDRTTVLRDGQLVTTQSTSSLTLDELIRLMVGRRLSEQFPKVSAPRGKEMLRVEGVHQGGKLRDIHFSAYAGEILGIAGLVGAGRTEMVRAIFGADLIDGGKIYVEGKEVRITSPRDAIRAGIALLTEDRKGQGLVLKMSTRENITMSILDRLTALIFTSQKKEADLAQRFIEDMNIKTAGHNELVMNLSGGNQQKVVLSKWMATQPRILIFDEPTRGIDVGAKVEIYKLMNDLAAQGTAILMVSSELPEILGMADRIIVLHEGHIAGELSRAEASQEKILELATGAAVVEPQKFG